MLGFLVTLELSVQALFADPASQTFVSKTDYNRIGPKAIIDLVPVVL